jgi:hypothetical protein
MMNCHRAHLFRSWALILAATFLSDGSGDLLSAEFGSQTSDGARTSPMELRSYIEQFAGPNAADCGQFFLVRPLTAPGIEELRRFLSCGLDAAKSRKPFWTLKQEQGIDSAVFQGLLGTADGTIFRFSYDSAPCGGPGCAGRFSIQRCERPAVIANSEQRQADFRCEL